MIIKNDINKPIGISGKFTRLMFQIGWPFLAVIIILLSVVSYDVYDSIRKRSDIDNVISRDSLVFLTKNMGREQSAIIYNGNVITSLATKLDKDTLQKYTQKLLLSRPQFPRIICYDNDSNISWQADSITGDSLYNLEHPKISPDFAYSEEYFDKVNNINISRNYFPIINDRGIKTGYIEIILDLSYFWNAISQLDADNVYLFNNKSQLLLSKKAYDEIKPKQIQIFDRYSSIKSNLITFTNDLGEKSVGIRMPVPNTNWIVIAEKSTKEIENKTRNLIFGAIILFSLVLILILIEIYQFRRKIFLPLKSLEDMSFRISKGDYDSWTLSWAGNEFDVVSMAMNQVVFSVKTIHQDFEAQINKKTKSLKDQIKDSEIMGSFMINRELRMIEIKNELDKVKSDLSKCKNEASSESADNIKVDDSTEMKGDEGGGVANNNPIS